MYTTQQVNSYWVIIKDGIEIARTENRQTADEIIIGLTYVEATKKMVDDISL